MECPQHGTVQSPLARFCVECGIQLSFETSDKEPTQRGLPYRDSTLVGYLEVFFVCDSSGMLHALDARLDDLAEPICCPDLSKISLRAPLMATCILLVLRACMLSI